MTRKLLLSSQIPHLVRPRACRPLAKAAFRTSARQSAASEFTMPAMSPTMTEGNITSWKVKEGDSYAPGDVLLSLETDKAEIEVEAQEEGIMAKILEQNGSKGIKVGTRIAIIAEAGDEIGSLDLSAVQSANQESVPEKASKAEESKEQEQQAVEQRKDENHARPDKSDSPEKSGTNAFHNARYPHFPSVIQLLHERGISSEESNKIPASGPSGRLLKGDVLAYLGDIKSSYAKDQSKRITGLGHLDLRNIELAPIPAPKAADSARSEQPVQDAQAPKVSEVALPISLAAVENVRQRIKRVLGIDMSVETFIARATQLCNEDLPQSKSRTLSADELFDAVLGLDKVQTRSSGSVLIPQIQTQSSELGRTSESRSRARDIIDELSSSASAKSTRPARRPKSITNISPSVSLFSVSVPTGDERRARVFLERLKTVLQVEPDKLVL